MNPRRVGWSRVCRKFWRGKVEAQSVGPWLKVDKRFEVAIVDRPLLRRKVVLVVVDCHLSVERL